MTLTGLLLAARGALRTLGLVGLGAVVAGSARAAGNPDEGRDVYRSNCAVCHGSNAAANVNGILGAAGEPAQITAAFKREPQMNFLLTLLSSGDIEDVAAYLLSVKPGGGGTGGGGTGGGGNPVPTPRTVTVVEFYHAGFDHFFVSALQPDIEALDSGRLAGWARTGRSFKAYENAGDAPSGAMPVCRFYIPPAQGDSHFYSASPAECEQVRQKFPTFSFESAAVMFIHLPDPATGACPAGTVAVFRVWNARVDSNHRYTTDIVLRDDMVAKGHVAEGYGPSAVIMCAPA